MCANFKPITSEQVKQLGLPDIPFEYVDEIYPGYKTPLLFKSIQTLTPLDPPTKVCEKLNA